MNEENIPEPRNISNQHPRVMQTLMMLAVNTLTPKQKEIWFRYNNERLTQDEIATLFGVSQSTIRDNIRGIETKLTKYCKSNLSAYLLLQVEHKIMNEENA